VVSRLPSFVRGGVLATAGFVALVSCGSRTGLFVELPDDASVDASLDAPDPPFDATLDAPDARDATVDAPLDGPIPCVPGTFGFQLAIPQIMFVLDRSGSMAFSLGQDTQPPPGRPTRWTTLRDALQQTIVPFDQELAMGAKFFPEANADPFNAVQACVTAAGVGIAPAVGNAQNILNVFGTTSPVGGTPTASALQLAAQYLASSRTISRAMVLATDGAPNCNGALNKQTCTCVSSGQNCQNDPEGEYDCLDDTATVSTISGIFASRNIPVYVIGIGGINFGNVLDAMAVAGGRPRAGTPRYYAATTAAEMATAFGAVRDSVAKCSYITPSSPDDAGAISVVVGGATVPRDTTRTNGWDWIDQQFGHLQLFGAACTAATKGNVSGTIACKSDE
jgi:von Willebrand factor type A domain